MTTFPDPVAPVYPAPTSGRFARKRSAGTIIAILVLVEIISAFESSMVFAAIPTLIRDFGSDAGTAGWTVTAFLLVAAVAAAVCGRIGDMYGRERVLVVILVGLGTPGGHPYINGLGEANTVTDIVQAARSLNDSIGTDWVAAGHSQGGQAALFTAQHAATRQPALSLKGAVAIAPGGIGLSRMVEFVDSGGPGAEAAAAFLPLIVLGAHVVQPAIDPGKLFTPAARPMLQAAHTGCVAQIREVPPIPPTEIFEHDADFGALTRYLEEQDPSVTAPAVPVMIAQGSADTLVTRPSTDALVDTLCGKGATFDYRIYENQDHRATVPGSLADAQRFVAAALSGEHPTDTCTAR
ncbi:MFS transporter [Nocardia testacea]|uniref:MFS transporter n=1 Tax=Nocardia testacea TaxID=248551 RepID=UPI00031197E8|nr:MFS transporter [Nocardia testacea]